MKNAKDFQSHLYHFNLLIWVYKEMAKIDVLYIEVHKTPTTCLFVYERNAC